MTVGIANAPMMVIVQEVPKRTVVNDVFLPSREDWPGKTVVHVLAAQEGFREMSEDKRDFLKFVREYYLKHIFCPIVRVV
jgi:sulfur relay (sulfurtransferase) DsrC/TusE family protein